MHEPALLPVFSAYQRHANATQHVASALCAARAILDSEAMPVHRRELLGICLWKLSEAAGLSKYATRCVSLAALDRPVKELAHEHVYERAKLVRLLMSGCLALDELADFAIACVVLRTQHRVLSAISCAQPSLDGWARYRAASVAVIDRERKCWLIAP